MDSATDVEKYFIDWAQTLIEKIIKIEKEPYGDEGIVYRVETSRESYFIKIKFDSVSPVEYEKLQWLQGKIIVPQVIGFTTKDNAKALLLSALPGKNLKVLSKEWPAEKVIKSLVQALKEIHAVAVSDWSFNTTNSQGVLVHGDACLPNFIFDGDTLSGYIDVGDMQIGNPEIDLAASIWSLQHNLGHGHGESFLREYGYAYVTEEIVEKLRLQYEDYQRDHGFSLE